jgi:hypothetical protein
MQQAQWGIDPAADHSTVIASPTLVYAVALVSGFILDWLWPLNFLPEGWSLVVGFFLIFIAINIKTYAVREMVRVKTNLNVRKPTTLLQPNGPLTSAAIRFTLESFYSTLASPALSIPLDLASYPRARVGLAKSRDRDGRSLSRTKIWPHLFALQSQGPALDLRRDHVTGRRRTGRMRCNMTAPTDPT